MEVILLESMISIMLNMVFKCWRECGAMRTNYIQTTEIMGASYIQTTPHTCPFLHLLGFRNHTNLRNIFRNKCLDKHYMAH